MTDTTDIKALRSEAANIIGLLTSEGHQSFSLDKTADFFDDVFRLLEAERQRADDEKALNKHLDLAIRQSEGVNANLRRLIEKAEAKLSRLKTEKMERELRLEGVITKQEAEISTLRGTQEPVGYLFESQLKDLMKGGIVQLWPVAAFGETVKLFTHPAKPVVVLPEPYDDGHGIEWFSRSSIESMLEAAGIVVKDGE